MVGNLYETDNHSHVNKFTDTYKNIGEFHKLDRSTALIECLEVYANLQFIRNGSTNQ